MDHFIQAVSLLIVHELFTYYILNCKNTHTHTHTHTNKANKTCIKCQWDWDFVFKWN